MLCKTPWLHAAALSLCALISGCTQPYFCETLVQPDGCVQRTVIQPFDDMPEAVRQPNVWDQYGYSSQAPQLGPLGWPESLNQLPRGTNSPPFQFVVARKKVPSVDQIPDHMVIKAPNGIKVPSATLVRDYARTDYGFLTEHRWKETLTDCVTRADMRKARAELADLVIRLGQDVFKEIHGDEYDISAFVAWCRGSGKDWFNEFTEVIFDPELENDATRRKEALLTVCAKHGLELKELGQPFDETQSWPKTEIFLRDLFLALIRHKDGTRIDEATAAHFLDELKQQDPTHRVDKAFEAVVARKYGGKEALERRLLALFFRVAGLHTVFSAHLQIDNVLSLPGYVVETNGALIAKDRVRWQADSSKAYPFGYAMTCRSLEPAPAMLALLPGQPLAGRDAMIRFVRLVAPHEALRKALQACHEVRSLKPLSEYQKSLANRPNARAEAEAFTKLKDMLKIELE